MRIERFEAQPFWKINKTRQSWNRCQKWRFSAAKQASVNIISSRVNRCFAPNKYFPAQLSESEIKANLITPTSEILYYFAFGALDCVKFPPRRRVRTNKPENYTRGGGGGGGTHAQPKAPLRDDFQSRRMHAPIYTLQPRALSDRLIAICVNKLRRDFSSLKSQIEKFGQIKKSEGSESSHTQSGGHLQSVSQSDEPVAEQLNGAHFHSLLAL